MLREILRGNPQGCSPKCDEQPRLLRFRFGLFKKSIAEFNGRRATIPLMVTAPIDTAPYSEAARRILRPENCPLAVIDVQEKLLPMIKERKCAPVR